MRTVDYSDVLRGTAALAGFTLDDLGEPEFRLFREFHDRRLQVAWDIHPWPDIVAIERRQFRPSYDATGYQDYVAGDEVLDVATNNYLQCLQFASGQAPTLAGVVNAAYWAPCQVSYAGPDWQPSTGYAVGDVRRYVPDNAFYQCVAAHTSAADFDPVNWGRLTPFNRYVAFAQPGETEIAEVIQAWDRDPRGTTKLARLPYRISADGAQFTPLQHGLTGVWLQFRRARPGLQGDAFDAELIYASGRQVYFTPTAGAGNFYTAVKTTAAGESPATTPAKWQRVALPPVFRQYLIAAGYADWLTSDGQADKAPAAEAWATQMLELEADKLFRQQQQTRRFDIQ